MISPAIYVRVLNRAPRVTSNNRYAPVWYVQVTNGEITMDTMPEKFGYTDGICFYHRQTAYDWACQVAAMLGLPVMSYNYVEDGEPEFDSELSLEVQDEND